ncbi:MAG: hypothetical protein ACFFDF_21035 [Candidatus Odinarchaeota archaeon]
MFTVDTTGDGKPDSLQIKVRNLIIPFVIPEKIEIGDFNIKNFDPDEFEISKYGKFFLDDEKLDFSKEGVNLDTINERILIYHKGESFNLNNIIEGKLSGRTINLHDNINFLLKLDEDSLKKFTKGTHFFKIESDLISNLIIEFELDETNMNIKFDPMNF